MAAVTNVRVESNGISITTLRWTDNGGAANLIYRSTDGSAYTNIASVAVDGTELYEDSFLESNTKYWYKISNDAGSTFSSVVTVWTHNCRKGTTQANTIAGNNIDSEQANAPMVGGSSPAYIDRCWVCADDNRIELDCSKGCNAFQVVATDDINSISVINCGPCPPVDFIVPEGQTVGICGWPPGCDNVGDECFEGPITGPRTGKTSGLSYTGAPPGGTSSSDSCGCPCGVGQASLWLSIACCEEDGDCTLRCDRSAGGKSVVSLKACGGVPPFRWSVTGNANIVGQDSKGDNRCVRVTLDNSDEGGTQTIIPGIQITTFHYDCPSTVANPCSGLCSCEDAYFRERSIRSCAGVEVEDDYCSGTMTIDLAAWSGTVCNDISGSDSGAAGALVPCIDTILTGTCSSPAHQYSNSNPGGLSFSGPDYTTQWLKGSSYVDGVCGDCDDVDIVVTVTDFAGVSATLDLGL